MYEKVSLQGDAAIEKIILLIVERMRPTSGLEPGTQEVSGVCQGREGMDCVQAPLLWFPREEMAHQRIRTA